MAHFESIWGRLSLVGFVGRPVLNRPGTFDDRRDPAEVFYGGWIGTKFGDSAPTLNLFFLARDRDHAIYQQGIAADRRRTAGLRLSDAGPEWDYAIQAAGQFGSFGNANIGAFGFAGDFGWHPDMWGRPRVGLSFDYASGDRHPGDGTLKTFDVLYPNLGYFSDAPVYFPGNTVDLQPNVTVNLPGAISVRAGADAIFRLSKNDAVYEPPGIPLVAGNGTGPSYVATLAYLRADWLIDQHVQLSVSAVHGFTGSLVDTAAGRDFNYGAVLIDFKL